MAVTDASKTRAPRGAKPVSQAFLGALDSLPEASRAAVAKAALAMVRDKMKIDRDKAKAATAKDKAAAKSTTSAPKRALATKMVASTAEKPARIGKSVVAEVAPEAKMQEDVSAAPKKRGRPRKTPSEPVT